MVYKGINTSSAVAKPIMMMMMMMIPTLTIFMMIRGLRRELST
jgi:hypothetical protein